MNRTCSTSLAIPFLAGLGTGVALALVLAPRSGSATRGLIARKIKEGEGWVKDTAAVAEDYLLTQEAGLRSGIKEASAVLARS